LFVPQHIQSGVGQTQQPLCYSIKGPCNATLKRHNLSTADYFNRVTGITDNLVAAGEPLREDEIVTYLLTGLSEEYDSLVTSVMTRAEPMSLSDVYTNLLSFEARLINRQEALAPPGSPMANYASEAVMGAGTLEDAAAAVLVAGVVVALVAARAPTMIMVQIVRAAKSVDATIMLQASAGITMMTPTSRKTSTPLLRHPLRHTLWMHRGTLTWVP
jgi:hypothetical protein